MFGKFFVFFMLSVPVLGVQRIFTAPDNFNFDQASVKYNGDRVSRESEKVGESDSLTKSDGVPTTGGHNGESLNDIPISSNDQESGATHDAGDLNLGEFHHGIDAGPNTDSFPNGHSNLEWPLGGALFRGADGGFGNSFSASINNVVNQRTKAKSSHRKFTPKGSKGGVANSESVVINNGDGKVATGEATAFNDKEDGIVEHKVLVIVPAEDPSPDPATQTVDLIKESEETKANSEFGDKNETNSANMDAKHDKPDSTDI